MSVVGFILMIAAFTGAVMGFDLRICWAALLGGSVLVVLRRLTRR